MQKIGYALLSDSTRSRREIPEKKLSPPRTSLQFQGIRSELERLQALENQRITQEAKAAALQKEQNDCQEGLAAMDKVYLEVNGKSLTGRDLLALTEEVSRSNNFSILKNLKRAGLASLVVFWIAGAGLPFIFTAPFIWRSPEKLNKDFSETFSMGFKRPALEKIFQKKTAEAEAALKQLSAIGLIDCSHEQWKLTPTGKKVLLLSKSGAEREFSNTKAPAPLTRKPVVETAKPRETIHSRLSLLRVMLIEDAQGNTGWQLLKALEKQQNVRSGFSKLMGTGLKGRQIFLALSGVLNKEAFNAKMEELRYQGLIEKTSHSEKGAEASRWRLTESGKKLAAASDPFVALKIVESDLEALFNHQMERIKTQKAEKLTEVTRLETQLKQAKETLERDEKLLIHSETSTLALDIQLKETRDAESGKRLSRQLNEALFQTNLLQQQVTFQKQQIEKLTRQVTASDIYCDKWIQKANQAILTLQESLLQLKARQDNQSLSDVMTQLNSLEDQTQGDQKLFQELVASFDLKETDSSENSQTAAVAYQTALALNQKEVSQTTASQLEAIRKRHSAPSALEELNRTAASSPRIHIRETKT